MDPVALLSLLCGRPDLADQLIGGTIASVRHQPTTTNGMPIPVKVAIIDGHQFAVAPLFVDIEDPAAAQETYRLYKCGALTLVESDADDGPAMMGIVDGHRRLSITVDPAGDRLRVTFVRGSDIA